MTSSWQLQPCQVFQLKFFDQLLS